MSRETALLLSSDTKQWNVVGDPAPADGFDYSDDPNHIIEVAIKDFKGRLWLEASLAAKPQDGDWFPIWLTDDTPYMQFPLNGVPPTMPIGGTTGDNGPKVFSHSFQIKAVWIRARIDRSYLGPEPRNDLIGQYGSVLKVLLNH